MKRFTVLFSMLLVVVWSGSVLANSAPVVSNVSASQRGDDSKLVDIYYDLADADGDTCTIWVVASDNGGLTYHIPVLSVSGHVGSGVVPGTNKHIIWDAGTDMPGYVGNFRVRVFATDGHLPEDMVLVPASEFPYQGSQWTYVQGFYIDKFEVTNAKYCQFLNEDDPDGNHYSSNMDIIQTGQAGSYSYTVVPGKGQYPVYYVSCYDSEAYAVWKSNKTGLSYRLPTEQEWEKAAGWDPVQQHHYTYGFQQDIISCSWCNYNNCYGGGALPVGSFNGTGGKENAKSYYGCYDMSGNLWEWTSSIYSGSSRVIRGGTAGLSSTYCAVTCRMYYDSSNSRNSYVGFRLVLDLD